MGTYFLNISLEWVWHGKRCLAAKVKNRPIDDIGGKKALILFGIARLCRRSARKEISHEFPSRERARVFWRMFHGLIDGIVGRQSRSRDLFKESILEFLV